MANQLDDLQAKLDALSASEHDLSVAVTDAGQRVAQDIADLQALVEAGSDLSAVSAKVDDIAGSVGSIVSAVQNIDPHAAPVDPGTGGGTTDPGTGGGTTDPGTGGGGTGGGDTGV